MIERKLPGAPHETLLVVDATTGQNGLQQRAVRRGGRRHRRRADEARRFREGRIAVAIAHELGLPVKLIGIGERLEDLRPFDPNDFAPRAGNRTACAPRGRTKAPNTNGIGAFTRACDAGVPKL